MSKTGMSSVKSGELFDTREENALEVIIAVIVDVVNRVSRRGLLIEAVTEAIPIHRSGNICSFVGQ